MHYLDKQVDDLLKNESIDDITPNEKLDAIKSQLEWDKYVDTQLDLNPNNNPIYNPAIEKFKKEMDWTEQGWDGTDIGFNILSNYPEYVPSTESIKYLSKLDNILEIGAGNGYWSHVINENNGNCYPTDISPKQNDYPTIGTDMDNQYPVTIDDDVFSEIIWTEVYQADHTIISDYPNHDILFCHPEGLRWTEEVLDLIKTEQKLILIASWYPGPDATPFFFKELIDNWSLEEIFPIHTYKCSHAKMYIFEKI